MGKSIQKVQPHAVTIHVNDLYKWLELIVKIEKAIFLKRRYHGEEILGPKWVYRGQANATWEIASSFERLVVQKTHKDVKTDEVTLRMREKAAMSYFKRWAELSKQDTPDSTGEWLALMRHYEIPTRLIDFSEMPLMALAFSLEDEQEESSNFAIWAVLGRSSSYEACETMRQIRKGARKVEMRDTLVSRVQSDECDRAEMERILSDDQDLGTPRILRYVPIGMNDRQKRQRGLFLSSTHLSRDFMPLLHDWTNTTAADFQDPNFEMCVDEAFSSGEINDVVANARLVKYVFDKNLRDTAKVFLQCCNITSLTRYGGIERVAEETKDLLVDGFYK